jgi:hypothetical protein
MSQTPQSNVKELIDYTEKDGAILYHSCLTAKGYAYVSIHPSEEGCVGLAHNFDFSKLDFNEKARLYFRLKGLMHILADLIDLPDE